MAGPRFFVRSGIVGDVSSAPILKPSWQMIDVSPELRLEEVKRGFRKRVRFAVRSPEGRCSAAWLTTDNKSGFYIGVQSSMGLLKISLHTSGMSRLAFTETYRVSAIERGLIPPEEDRALVKWRRSPTPAIGAALAVSLLFPTDFLHLDPP